MSSPDENPDQRQKQAARILEQPDDYKVCEGCGSIVTIRTSHCPSCHAYLFDESSDRVAAQAKLLAARQASSVLSSDLA